MRDSYRADGSPILAPPLVLGDGEILSIATVIVETNEHLSGAKFSVDGDDAYRERLIEKIVGVVTAVFGVSFGQLPQQRHGDIRDLFDQVSMFAEYLAKDHYFTDGNKRTATLAALGILQLHGIRIGDNDSPDVARNFIYQWIQSMVSSDESQRMRGVLAQRLRDRAVYTA